jgi:UDP-glucose 4-epimerase
MRVLVTGGSGFLGAAIVERLVARGIAVRVFDRVENRALVEAIAPGAAAQLDWQVGDIVDGEAVAAATTGCDGIIHLAGVLTPACQADPVRGMRINVIGTLNVFEAARAQGIARVIYTSSTAVFGSRGSIPWPQTHYGASKLACEGSARAYWADHGLASIGLRPYVVYGPGRETGISAGPSLACRAAARGERYTIPYRGRAGLVFVDDVAAAYELALLREPDGALVLNVVGVTASNEEVIEAIRRIVPDAAIDLDGPELGIAPDVDDSDLHAMFPGQPRTSLQDGIARTIAFYRQQPS